MSTLSRLGSWRSQSNRQTAQRRARKGPGNRTLLLEALEQRTVLSADGLGNVADPPLMAEGPQYDSSSILVRFKPGAAATNAAGIVPGASNGRAFSLVPGLRVVKLGQGLGVEAALQAFRANPNVLYAEPNYRVGALLTPNDPDYGALYGMESIAAPQAWDLTTGNGSVVVGVIDTGVDYNHPDLNDNIWTNPAEASGTAGVDDDKNGYIDDVHGYDFVNNDGDPFDDHYHGTHVSGTIGAEGNNGIGVAGVAWDVQIMGLKFLDAGGGGYTADAIAAIDYATMMRTTHGVNVRVTSNSWGGGGYDAALLDAINASGDAGILFVAAAGNDALDADFYPMYPAAYVSDNILSVAATDASDNIAYFSNWGLDSVDLGAPGVDTLSTMPGNSYGYLSGTSMATPHVSGVAALAWSLNPNATPADIRNVILGNVDPIAALNTSGSTPVATGGRLNAFKTLQAVGMAVAGSEPAAGSIIATTPNDFVVHFSHPYAAATVQAGDLTVNGSPADTWAPIAGDTDSVTFHFNTSPVTAQGLQTMQIAAGAIAATSGAGLPDPLLHEWNTSFWHDLVRMEIVSTSPGGPLAGVPLTKFELNLNEPVDPDSVSESDLYLYHDWLGQATVNKVEFLNSNTTIRFWVDGITELGTLYANVAGGAFTDEFGNPNLPFADNYTLVTGMAVAGSIPAEGDVILGAVTPTDFVVHFTLPYDSVDPGDFTVNGFPATSRTLDDSDTVTFHFATSPITQQGEQLMQIAAGAIAADPDVGLPDPAIHQWTGTFRWDLAPMEVVSTSPPEGSAVQLPLATIDVHLNEAVALSSVQAGDLQLSQGVVTGFSLDNEGKTIRFAMTGINAEGTLSASIAPGALTDVSGNPSLEFAASYSLDIGTVPFPALSPASPQGSLIYSQAAAGIIGAAGDTDSFTINIAAGQTVTVLVTPASTLQPTVTMGGSSVAASGPGKKALLQTISAAGLQTITVGAAGGSAGSYSIQVYLNAALETESHDGAGNNTTPQDLNASFVTIATTTVSASRGAVMGRTDGSPTVELLNANFETTTGPNAWTIDPGTNNLWHNSIGHRNEPGHSAAQSMYFGAGEKYVTKGGRPATFTEGTYEVVKKGKGGGAQIAAGTITSPNIPLAAGGQVTVNFNYLLETQSTAGLDLAQLQIKPTGSTSWTTLATYNDVAESNTWIAANTVDISAFAGQTVQLRFSFNTVTAADNKFEGWYVDDVVVRQTTPHDNYSFTVGAGERVTVAVESAGNVNVLLQNAAGTATLATGAAGPTNVRNLIDNFGPLAAGTYRLAITGQTNTPYTMVVLKGAAFDSESNDTYATAQDHTGVPGVLGHVTAGSDLFALRGTPVSGGLVLAGSQMTLGIAADGSFISGGAGIQFLGNEFVIPGTPVAGFTIGQNGLNYTNKAAVDSTEIAVTLEDLSSGDFHGVRIVGMVGGGLQLERVIAFRHGDRFATIATRLTNASGATIDNVAWLENLDPDQGEPLGYGFETYNDVVLGGQFVRADNAGGLTIGLGTADPRRVVSAQGFDNRDPFEIINWPIDPDGAFEDIGINLAFNFGTLAAGQSVAGSMIMTFGQSPAEAEAIYTANTGGTLVADEDWFLQTVGADGILHVETSTPGDGGGSPGNTLNPRIEVFGTSQTVPVYLGMPLGDGRNEVVHVEGLAPGTVFRIRITAEAGTSGAFFLDPPVEAPAPASLLVAASTAESRKAGPSRVGTTSLSKAAVTRKAASSQRALDADRIDAAFASSGKAGRKAAWYQPRPQVEIDEALVELVARSESRGRKGVNKIRR